MLNTRASERYAKSLLSLSIDKNIVAEISSDIDLLIKSFEDSREVVIYIQALLYLLIIRLRLQINYLSARFFTFNSLVM